MGWVKTSDTARLHGKFFRAGVAAWGWWNAALGYCNDYLTDGFIPAKDIEFVFPGTPRDDVLRCVDALTREESLHVVQVGRQVTCRHAWCRKHKPLRDGYLMHDYDEFQPLRAHAIKKRRANVVSGRQGGIASGISRKQNASPETKQTRSDPRSPVPSRPVPSPNTKPEPPNVGDTNGLIAAVTSRLRVAKSGHIANCDCPSCGQRVGATSRGEPEKTR